MHKEQLSKISELSNGHISASGCLESFNAANADSDMCCLYHGYVVRAVTDSQKDCFKVSFHQLDHKGFLQRRYTATENQ
jgi:hypothetical protein